MRLVTIVLDVLMVLVFAVAGRASHYDTVTPTGVLQTAWPFAVGVLAAWVIAGRTRWALRSLRSGLLIWPITVAVGMGLRLLIGEGTAPAFILVATGVLGLGLLGWRIVAALLVPRAPGARHVSESESDSTGGIT